MTGPVDPLAVGLRPYFWAFLIGLAGYVGWNFEYHSAELLVAGVAALATALAPAVLWMTGRATGLPIFPLFAATSVQWNAMPLLTGHPAVMAYGPAIHLQSGLTVAGFYTVATAAWLTWVRARSSVVESVRVFAVGGLNPLLTAGLCGVVAFNVAAAAGWLPDLGQYFTTVKNATNAAGVLALFVLWYEYGQGRITGPHRVAFLAAVLAELVVTTAGLILAHTFATVFVSVTAYVISRHRVPVLPIVGCVSVLGFLHPGKYEMRAKYTGRSLAPDHYPTLFAEWATASLERLSVGDIGEGRRRKKATSSVGERASVVHMMMLVQSKTPADIPFLAGESYERIPELLVPRAVYTAKPTAHVGTSLLGVRYGLQTESATRKTTISFSLESEAYANFGYLGVAGMAAVIGWGFAWLSVGSTVVGRLTLRHCAALATVGVVCNSFASAGICVSTLSQTLFTLYGLGLILTRPVRPDGDDPHGIGR